MRLDGGTLVKGSGTVNGAAYVGWDSTYSFNADARGIPVDHVVMFRYPAAPPGGLIDFTAGGSGNFNEPHYDVRFRINNLSVGDEPVGQVTGTFGVRGKELSGEFDAASPRLAMSGTGRVSPSRRRPIPVMTDAGFTISRSIRTSASSCRSSRRHN